MIWLPCSSTLSSPLLKIPLLCSAVSLVVLAQTPPTPTPSADEKAKYGPRKQTKLVSRKTAPYIVRTVHGANLICECAVICCARFPSHLADTLQSFLVRRPFHTAHDVRITPWWLTGCLLMSAGGILRLMCYRTLGRLFTWEPSIQNGHVLITSGPYAVVRHPAYLGSLMVAVGAIVYAVCPGSWFYECVGWDAWWGKAIAVAWAGWQLLVPTVLMSRVDREDKILQEHFGAEWEKFAARTKYKLIPGIY